MIENERIHFLNENPINQAGKYVIYWMQSSQRIEYNHAFEYALDKANQLNKNLVVYFGITEQYPEANERHYYFMLEGLKEIKAKLYEKNIRFLMLKGSPEVEILNLNEAVLIVSDAGYLRHEKLWRKYVSEQCNCQFVNVETNVIVPVKYASNKEEYSAATLRRKLSKLIDEFLILPQSLDYRGGFESELNFYNEILVEDTENVIKKLNIDKNVKKITQFVGGTSQAKKLIEYFLENKLEVYDIMRNEPSGGICSEMSPYLHFGQISPVYIYKKVLEFCEKDSKYDNSKKSYLEELFVRRELAMNFVNYNEHYDSYEGIPNWAKVTLEAHVLDNREYVYELEQLEKASTHDMYWNAAQNELILTGKMQGYMRMYWGKKVIEWTENPRKAYEILIYLNNKYELDGRDANGYAGVAWCFGKHDRPWGSRNIFGNVRYMANSGLKRKFDMEKYIDKYRL